MTTPLTFTVTINSVAYDIKAGTFKFGPAIEQRTKLSFTVLDPQMLLRFKKDNKLQWLTLQQP